MDKCKNTTGDGIGEYVHFLGHLVHFAKYRKHLHRKNSAGLTPVSSLNTLEK
jgi:hypothetical protein